MTNTNVPAPVAAFEGVAPVWADRATSDTVSDLQAGTGHPVAYWLSREQVETESVSAHVQRTDVFDPSTGEVSEGETVLAVSLGTGDQVQLNSAAQARSAAFALFYAADVLDRALGDAEPFKIIGPEFEPIDGTFSKYREVKISSHAEAATSLISAPNEAPGWGLTFLAPNDVVSTEMARAFIQRIISATNLADFLTREGV